MDYIGTEVDVVIPSEIKGKPVTRIGEYVFGCLDDGQPYSDITSITIPESVTYIDDWAFEACALLKDKIINHSSLNAEKENYWRAQIYDKEVNGLAIKGSTVIKAINKNITEAIIPEGVTEVGYVAFAYCPSLEKVTIPKTVTSINSMAFWDSYILKDGVINNSLITDEHGGLSFFGGTLYDKKENGMYIGDKKVVGVIDKNITEINIPEGVEKIISGPGFDGGMFSNCIKAKKIIIPESITYIDYSAFQGLFILKDNFVNNSSLNAEEENYWGATLCDKEINGLYIKNNTIIGVADKNMTKAVIPEGVTSIGYWAFFGCRNLTSITIPEGVTSIDNFAFEHCDSLTSITIPESVTSIGDEAFPPNYILGKDFINKSSLNAEENDYWGAKVYDEKRNGFYIANKTVIVEVIDKSITEAIIPNGITSICARAFEGCENLTSIAIPEGVTRIGDGAFSECRNLTSITIPEGVTRIGNGTFFDCGSLTNITIPEGITSIGIEAFKYCGLTSITIPESVTYIDDWAFYYSSLTSIKGKAGSYAETWAKENGYTFIAE